MHCSVCSTSNSMICLLDSQILGDGFNQLLKKMQLRCPENLFEEVIVKRQITINVPISFF